MRRNAIALILLVSLLVVPVAHSETFSQVLYNGVSALQQAYSNNAASSEVLAATRAMNLAISLNESAYSGSAINGSLARQSISTAVNAIRGLNSTILGSAESRLALVAIEYGAVPMEAAASSYLVVAVYRWAGKRAKSRLKGSVVGLRVEDEY